MKNEIFKPSIDKNINNNEKVFYSSTEEYSLEKQESLDEFFNRISSSGSYIFSHKVIIKTKDNLYETKIAGRVGNSIITVDDNVIPINDVISIEEI